MTAILAAGPVATHAQAARTPAADSLTTRFTGVWDGRFITDHGPEGVLQLTVSRDTAWKMTIEMVHDDQAMPSRASDVKVDGKTISWTQEVMGMSCAASAKVDGNAMTGDASCGSVGFKMALKKQ